MVLCLAMKLNLISIEVIIFKAPRTLKLQVSNIASNCSRNHCELPSGMRLVKAARSQQSCIAEEKQNVILLEPDVSLEYSFIQKFCLKIMVSIVSKIFAEFKHLYILKNS